MHQFPRMKKFILIVLLALPFFLKSYGQSGLCDTSYWNHTYHNYRLKIYDSCVTITATIKYLIPPVINGDGDYHIYVTPDSPYLWMINYIDSSILIQCGGHRDSIGIILFPGTLNVEEICKGPVTDPQPAKGYEDSACLPFNDLVYLPNANEHVSITGPYVMDIDHCWNELHPVSHMAVVPVTGVSGPDWANMVSGLKVYPQPASDKLNFRFQAAPHAVTLIKLYNISGQLMFIYGMAETNSLELDISSWPAGEYLYSIVAADQNKILKNGKISVVK